MKVFLTFKHYTYEKNTANAWEGGYFSSQKTFFQLLVSYFIQQNIIQS